jgi:hypothetical protein
MNRAIVNVATTDFYRRGQDRLFSALQPMDEHMSVIIHRELRDEWPTHQDKPYAFKSFALLEAARHFDLLIWADSCIIPVRSMEPLWERIERDGYWMSENGFSNYEWTADSAYQDLFRYWQNEQRSTSAIREDMYRINRTIPHVVATAFGLNARHPKGKAFLDEYFRLASETKAFCGPWLNANHPDNEKRQLDSFCARCGPPDVRGHRHDQTAASVIAWRLGFELTKPPNIFAYRGGETEETILVADGAY